MKYNKAQREGRAAVLDRTDKSPRVTLCLLAALLLGLICGCESYPDNSAMAGSYYLDSQKDLHTLGRVALVELDNVSAYPEISSDVTKALFLELQKKQIFGLVVVPQNDPAWRGLQENLDSLQAMRALGAMRETLRCNGLLVGTVTEYRPYPRLVLGLRLKLLDLTNGQLLWGIEQVWDSTDRTIHKRVQAYFKSESHAGLVPLREELVIISSLEFAKFAASEVAGTLVGSEK
jgi:hypothetical protein